MTATQLRICFSLIGLVLIFAVFGNFTYAIFFVGVLVGAIIMALTS